MNLNEKGVLMKLRTSCIVVYSTLAFSIFMLLYPFIYSIQKMLPPKLHLIWLGITSYDFNPIAVPYSIWRMFNEGWGYFEIIGDKGYLSARLQLLTTVIFLTLTILCITVWKKSEDKKVKGMAKIISILNLLIFAVSSVIVAFSVVIFSNWSP